MLSVEIVSAFASRDEDWIDVRRILEAQGRKLNLAQIFDELRPLADLKQDDAILRGWSRR